jgi:hypothetical protein
VGGLFFAFDTDEDLDALDANDDLYSGIKPPRLRKKRVKTDTKHIPTSFDCP